MKEDTGFKTKVMTSYDVKNVTLNSYFLECFSQKYMLNFVAGFLSMYEDNDFFSISVFICCVLLMDFLILKELCVPDINPT